MPSGINYDDPLPLVVYMSTDPLSREIFRGEPLSQPPAYTRARTLHAGHVADSGVRRDRSIVWKIVSRKIGSTATDLSRHLGQPMRCRGLRWAYRHRRWRPIKRGVAVALLFAPESELVAVWISEERRESIPADFKLIANHLAPSLLDRTQARVDVWNLDIDDHATILDRLT